MRRRRASIAWRRQGPVRAAMFVGASLLVGLVLGGPGGAVIGGLAALIAIYEARLVALYTFLAVVLTAILSVFETPLQPDEPIALFVGQHPNAARVGQLGLALLFVAVVGLCVQERIRWRAPQPPAEERTPRRLDPTAAAPLLVFGLVFGLVLALVGDHLLRTAGVVVIGLVLVGLAALAVRRDGRGSRPISWRLPGG